MVTVNSEHQALSALSGDSHEIVGRAKVFVVGAGGIGCELIKNLVLVGFRDLEIIDLDTIDVSNLNRQFLFQKKHVGRSKAGVAHENAVSLRHGVHVVSHHASIFNPQFNMEYFKRFDIVLNALDNRAARNHVNRLCLAAGVPLVESGSAGYLGQVNVIKKGATECYECSPKPRQKTFPGCTIRNTPSELIHCVVWAKYLFNQLFGEEDADQDVSPDTADPEAALTGSNNVERVSTRLWAKENDYHPEKIFNKLFKNDIEYLLSMKKLWIKRKPPKPVKWFRSTFAGDFSTASQKLLSFEENVAIFGRSITELKERFYGEGEGGMLLWDKDDDAAMSFVASAANIRAEVFGIAQKSIFELKSMAGNIIPAIATTNAIVAGLIVMQALCILQNEFSRCKNVFVSRVANPAKKLIAPCTLDPPLPSCYVCSEKPEVTVKLDATKLTLGDLKEKILKSHLGMLAPDVEIDGTGTILLSSEEGESDENLPKSLAEFKILHGSRLRADDFLQNFNLILNILHDPHLPEEKEFEVTSQGAIPSPKEDDQPGPSGDKTEEDSGDDLVIVENNGEYSDKEKNLLQDRNDPGNEDRKRKLSSARGDADTIEQAAKRAKMSPVVIKEPEDDVLIIE